LIPRPWPLKPAPVLPDWYPAWTKELADLYFSGTINTFVLYGNVHDLVRTRNGGGTSFVSLSDFLATQVFGAWDVTLSYDLGRGLRPVAGDDAKRLQGMVQYVSGIIGAPNTWPRDPDKVLDVLEPLLQRNLPGRDCCQSQTDRVSLRAQPVSFAVRRFGHAGPRPGGTPRAILGLGRQSVYQAAERRVQLDYRKTLGVERTAGEQSVCGDDRNPAAKRLRSGANSLRQQQATTRRTSSARCPWKDSRRIPPD